MNAKQIAEALGGKRNGDGFMCKCVAHDDRTPSLSIKDGDNGKVLFHCFAGCTFDEIATALRARGLMDGQAAPQSNPTLIRHEPEPRQESIDAAKHAEQVWNDAAAVASHPYLDAKGIKPHGIRVSGDALVLPMRDASGELQSIQYIHPDGTKLFLKDGRTAGTYLAIGKPDGRILLAEGFATGASLHEATGDAVAAAFSAGNLQAVAEALRKKLPKVELVVCADNDQAGSSKGKQAAEAVGGKYCVPKGERGNDFNDLAQEQGLDAVRDVVSKAKIPLEVRVGQLARMPELEAEQVLSSVAAHYGVPRAAVTKHVKIMRADEAEADSSDSYIFLEETEAWSDPVSGPELFADIVEAINKYLVLPDGAAETIALWVLHSYCHDAAHISPLLVFSSPSKKCGKTTALTLLLGLVYKPLLASNCTAAVLFRAVEKFKPTLLLDEADTFMRDNSEMRGVINSGHNRAGAYVLRNVGEDYEPKQFRTWCPKSIAAIGRLAPTLVDRAIVIQMRRKRRDEKVDRLRADRLDEFAGIRRKCARFAVDHMDDVADCDPYVPPKLDDRAADNWRTLLAIADTANCLDAGLTALKRLIPKDAEDEDRSILLLQDIRTIFDETGEDRLASKALVERLNEMEDRPWPGFARNGREMQPRHVSNLLKDYGIRPVTVRLDAATTAKGYDREQFNDAWGRYLPDLPVTTSQTNGDGAFSDYLPVTDAPDVTDRNPPKPLPDNDCYGVTDRTGGKGGVDEYPPLPRTKETF